MKFLPVFLALVLGTAALNALEAQLPTRIRMQAVAPNSLTPTPAPLENNVAVRAAETQNMMQLLQQMQATNAETIKKQHASR